MHHRYYQFCTGARAWVQSPSLSRSTILSLPRFHGLRCLTQIETPWNFYTIRLWWDQSHTRMTVIQILLTFFPNWYVKGGLSDCVWNRSKRWPVFDLLENFSRLKRGLFQVLSPFFHKILMGTLQEISFMKMECSFQLSVNMLLMYSIICRLIIRLSCCIQSSPYTTIF